MSNEQMEIRYIPLADIRPNDWNPNVVDAKTMKKLEGLIKKKGMIQPILLRPRQDDQGAAYFEIVDGYHRYTIMNKLEAKEIPAIVKDMDDSEAKLNTLNTNYMRGNPVPIRLANLLHDLSKTYDVADLEAMLPYDRVEIKDNLELLKIPADMERISADTIKQEKKLEPVFISATIYKDYEKSLHDFIEQAMLESEATFCTINIKIECGEEKMSDVVQAIQNLKAVDIGTDYAAGEEAPQVVRFALFPDQFFVVDEALLHIIKDQGLTKNARGRALELMAADYLAGAKEEDDTDQ